MEQAIIKRQRSFRPGGLELRTSENGGSVITGYAAPFNQPSQLIFGMFYEVIDPGYFDQVLREQELDVRVLRNHKPDPVYGRLKPSKDIRSLVLSADEVGLRFEVRVADTQAGRDLVEEVRVGNVDGMSIGHWVADADDDDGRTIDGYPVRKLRRCLKIDDISFATYPAYTDTTAELRALDNEMTAADYKELLRKQISGGEIRKRKLQFLQLDTK